MSGLRKHRLFIGSLLLLGIILYNLGQDWGLWIVYLVIVMLFSSALINFCPSDSLFCPQGDEKK